MHAKKSQAALEFLMTYGWAILAALAAIAGLAYFGVLSPDMLLPQKCVLPPGIACLDYKVEPFQVVLVLQNALGETITIDKVKVFSSNQECINNETTLLKNNDRALITITACSNGNAGQKFDGLINLTYTVEGKLTHTVSGTLKAKVVEGSSLSSQSICQDAETNGFCDGLDIVYGEGYMATCCSEHTLCC